MKHYFNRTSQPLTIQLRDGTGANVRSLGVLAVTPEQDGSADILKRLRKGSLTHHWQLDAVTETPVVEVAPAADEVEEMPAEDSSPGVAFSSIVESTTVPSVEEEEPQLALKEIAPDDLELEETSLDSRRGKTGRRR